jgi:glycosyltransferase involved in cell wall biosynthesis
MRITLVTPSLGAGGAERVAQVLAGGFLAAGHQVTVITTTSRPDFYSLPPEVARVVLDLTGAPPGRSVSLIRLPGTLLRLPVRLRRLRQELIASSPDAVVCFMEHANILVSLLVGRELRVILTEHSDPSRRKIGWGWRILRRLIYRKADVLVSVSAGVDAGFAWLPRDQRVVIPNPLPPDALAEGAVTSDLPAPYLVAMGRLSAEKGFDLLIEAFRRVADRCPEWSLVIIGDGEQREALSAQAARHGLQEAIHLVGAKLDPFPLLRGAEFFVLSSRWEGFGNVLAEALACGLPVVSFDCLSGPSEIVHHARNGLLVPPEDTAALAEALAAMMGDRELRQRLAFHAADSVVAFDVVRIVRRWDEEVLTPAESSATS